jgi:FkbH-like protein
MSESERRTELLHGYVQADAPARALQFPAFVKLLKAVASEEGPQAARDWAKLAASPLLDYSSLLKLRGILTTPAAPEHADRRLRLAILGGPTTTQLRQLIEIFLAAEGIAAEIYEAEYGLFRQELMNPSPELDAFAPQVILLATSVRDILRFPDLSSDDAEVARLADDEVSAWASLWEAANARWNATIIQNNFEVAPGGALGHYGLRHAASREHYVARLNRLFAERAPSYVVLHDLCGLAAEAGARTWFDPRFYAEFKMPCAAECLVTYAHSVVCLIRAVLGKSKKVLVLDLDNTLWGGVVGDLGAGGIRLGQGSGEGEAFLAFQRYSKDLQQRGVVLAVCSKNDDDKAREPFEKRPDMILKLSDMSVFVANWNNKADNLRTIAQRLDLKLDSFVFVDDNPAERALVRRLAPEVAVPDMPEDPAGYIQALAAHRYFETVAFTREDSSRARYYAENAQRRELSARSTDLGAFLASLSMQMRVEPVSALNIERVTQLINKSNQFNLTTRRYTLAQIQEMVDNPAWRTLTFSLRDSLGDNGLIAIILMRKTAAALDVDTWVMSCRVLQRGVENFCRNEIVELARREACAEIQGTYIPTAKNGMVANHFAGLGFEQTGASGDQTFWSLRIDDDLAPLANLIHRENGNG